MANEITEQDSARVVHAARMMVDLRRYAFDASLEETVQRACRESFAINVRKLVEFLTDRPNTKRLAAQDFLPTWKPPPTGASIRRRLGWAAKIAGHLDRDDVMVTPTSTAEFDDIAEVVTSELERFASDLATADHPAAGYFEGEISAHVRTEL